VIQVRQHEVSRVVEFNVRLRIADDVEIVLAEVGGDQLCQPFKHAFARM